MGRNSASEENLLSRIGGIRNAVDETKALRARVAELEGEVERLTLAKVDTQTMREARWVAIGERDEALVRAEVAEAHEREYRALVTDRERERDAALLKVERLTRELRAATAADDVHEALLRQVSSARAEALARAEKAEAERDEASAEVERLKVERDTYKHDFDVELDGNIALRRKYGARDGETMWGFFERVVGDRDAALARAENAEKERDVDRAEVSLWRARDLLRLNAIEPSAQLAHEALEGIHLRELHIQGETLLKANRERDEAKDAACFAFLDGAKWWQFTGHGSTAFPAEQSAMLEEAKRRYPFKPHTMVMMAENDRDLALARATAAESREAGLRGALNELRPLLALFSPRPHELDRAEQIIESALAAAPAKGDGK